MSDNNADELKRIDTRFNYVPLALEVCVSFIPFLLLVVWCLYWMLAEMTEYSDGLDWISMVRMVEMESSLFEERMADEKVDGLDLESDFGEASVFDKNRNTSTDKNSFISKYAERDEDEDIRISYLFLRDNGELIELDAEKHELSAIPEDSAFHHQALLALYESPPRESMRRFYYEYKGESYYRSFRLLRPTKPVRYGNLQISDGKPGSRILISGRFWYEHLQNNPKLDRKRLNIRIVVFDIVFVGIICLSIYLALRNLKQVIRIMQGFVSGNSDLTGKNVKLKDSGGIHEINELIDSFQLMFLSIQKYHRNISNIREIYEPTLPAAFLELFQHEDIRDIQPGDKAYVRGTAVSVQFIAKGDTDKTPVQERNMLCSRILDILASMNVIVTELEYDRITGIYPEKYRKDSAYEDKIMRIQSMDLTGSGVDELIVTETEGEFCYTIVGIEDHKRIRMEQISER